MAKKRKKKKKTRLQKTWRFLKIQLFLIALVIGALIYYYSGGYAAEVSQLHGEAVDLVASSDENTFRSTETSIAYDVNGETITVMKGEKDVYYVEYEDLPVYLKDAIVSIEDKRFYSHHGVDYKGIARAIWAMIRDREVTQGASTITQQLARNVFLTQDKTWERKIEEIYIAVELEKKYTKDEILEFYLNNIYFGNGYYGIGAAAKGYFNCSVSDLSLSQIAFLCGIPNNPTTYDPLTNYENAISRRDRILKNMLEDKKISESSYTAATTETITLNPPAEQEKNDYLTTYTNYCATRILMQLEGFEFKNEFSSDEEKETYETSYEELYNQCNQQLFTGGYRIYTSLDLNIQSTLQDTIDTTLSSFDETGDDGIYELQSAAVCIDNTTGMVKAIVGGRTQENVVGYTLNRGYQSYRQPGSTIKPLLVYTPALERGYTPDTSVVDEEIPDGPSNADGNYLGTMTLRRAVELSRNTVAYSILNEIGPSTGLEYLYKLGFTRIDANDNRPIAALGALTNGASPLEMAKGYAALENGGASRDPNCIMQITDSQGNVIYQHEQVETVIYTADAARQMTDILEGVFTEGTAKGLGLGDMPCAGKTGTTNESKDGWFVGYTPYYTTSVWVGYDDPRTLTGLTGASYPGQIWHSFMATIHDGLDPISFTDAITVMNNGNAWNTSVSTPEEQTVEESGATGAENTSNAPTGEGNTTETGGTTEGQAPAGGAENAGNATHAGDATAEEHNGDIDNGIAEGTVVP